MEFEFKKDDLIVEIGCDEPYRVLDVFNCTYFLSGTKNDLQHAFGIRKSVVERDFVKVGEWGFEQEKGIEDE